MSNAREADSSGGFLLKDRRGSEVVEHAVLTAQAPCADQLLHAEHAGQHDYDEHAGVGDGSAVLAVFDEADDVRGGHVVFRADQEDHRADRGDRAHEAVHQRRGDGRLEQREDDAPRGGEAVGAQHGRGFIQALVELAHRRDAAAQAGRHVAEDEAQDQDQSGAGELNRRHVVGQDVADADVMGTMIYSQAKEQFQIKKGPIFANFVLADEINRAPAKVQSALLEAMQERQVTIGEQTFKLDDPFLVMATQNPIEQEGTYPLPEAQVDRFMLKVIIGYPKKEEEKLIIRQNISGRKIDIKPVLQPSEIIEAREIVQKVYIDEKIERYIVDIVFATRFPQDYGLGELKEMISFGASPRASISLALAARAYAFLKQRGYVIPEDVRAVCHDVLRHRIGLSYEAEANNMTAEEIISEILNKVEVP